MNYAASFNISTTLPKILENNQNVDLLLFLDAANLWELITIQTLMTQARLEVR